MLLPIKNPFISCWKVASFLCLLSILVGLPTYYQTFSFFFYSSKSIAGKNSTFQFLWLIPQSSGRKKKFSKNFLLSVSSKTSPLLSRFEIWFCSTDTLFVWKIWACVGLRWQSTNYRKGKKICRNQNLGGIKKKRGGRKKILKKSRKKIPWVLRITRKINARSYTPGNETTPLSYCAINKKFQLCRSKSPHWWKWVAYSNENTIRNPSLSVKCDSAAQRQYVIGKIIK